MASSDDRLVGQNFGGGRDPVWFHWLGIMDRIALPVYAHRPQVPWTGGVLGNLMDVSEPAVKQMFYVET